MEETHMNRLIRWPGLAAFVVIAALCLAVWYLVVDYAAEYMVERTGTKAVGAEVELASADLTLFPLGLELNGLQVTNPKQPMRNALVAERIRMTFNPGHLIKGKTVVEAMSASGLAFNKERTTSGALPETKKLSEKGAEIRERLRSKLGEFPSLAAKNAKEILENEKLATIEEAEALRTDIAAARENFKARLDALPDKETFKEYKARIRNLREDSGLSGGVMGVIGKVDEVREIRKDIKKDLEVLRSAREDLSRSRAEFQNRLKDLKNAPARDAERLMEKYALSPKGISNMSALVFGPRYAQWVETSLIWYQRLSPYLAGMMRGGEKEEKRRRGEGVDVEFAPHRQIPEYWIKTADLAMEVGGGTAVGQFQDFSSNQQVLGQPLVFAFSGSGLKDAGTIEAEGHLDRTNPESPEDLVKFNLKQYPLSDFTLLDRQDMAVLLESARVGSAEGSIRVAGENLDADIQAVFDTAGFKVKSDQADNLLISGLTDTLQNIRSFDLSAELGGTIGKPDVRIASNIDDTLQAGLKQTLAKRQAELKSDIKRAVTRQTDDAVESVASGLAGLDAIKKAIQERLELGSSVLPG